MKSQNNIYLDYHATTPVDPEVFEAMKPYFCDDFGNATSNHSLGWSAKKAVERSREQVAQLFGGQSHEIFFTSGATESNNLAILGVAQAYQDKGRHIILSSIEHKSVLDCGEALKARGFEVSHLKVNRQAQVSIEELKALTKSNTILISVMTANNEVGTIQPLKEIAQWASENKIPFHTDSAQALGRVRLDASNFDLMSFSGHKLYGPKGIGGLYIKRRSPLTKVLPLFYGGSQERGLRAGTLNVPGIVGLGAACELAQKRFEIDFQQQQLLRDDLESRLKNSLQLQVNGDPENRLCNNLSVTLGRPAADILKDVKNIAVSTGATCGLNEPSHVLVAMGLNRQEALSTIRLSVGRFTTSQDVEAAANAIIEACPSFRSSQTTQKAVYSNNDYRY